MQHTVRQIFRILILSVGLLGCANQQSKVKTEAVSNQMLSQKVYFAPYDLVWRAAQLALKYPIAVNNMDHGVIETEMINAQDGFKPPHLANPPTDGIKYKISMNLVKGKIEGKEGIRVTVRKLIEKKSTFFSETQNLNSDGFEERSILYRIGRELSIEDGIKKAQQKEAEPQHK